MNRWFATYYYYYFYFQNKLERAIVCMQKIELRIKKLRVQKYTVPLEQSGTFILGNIKTT